MFPLPHADVPILIHGGALGDLVLSLQMLFRCTASDRGLVAIARVAFDGLTDATPPIHVYSADSLALHRLFTDELAPTSELETLLRRRVVFNALGAPDAPFHRRLAACEPAALFSFDPRPRTNASQHITDQWLDDLRRQGFTPPADHARRHSHALPSRAALSRGRMLLAEHLCNRGQSTTHPSAADALPTCLILPGSGGRAKCWPTHNFIGLVPEVLSRGIQPAFVIGPAESELWREREIQALHAAAPCLDMLALGDLTCLLAAADVVIANDSGPAHLAALLDRPLVAVFGPTSPAVWKPLGRRVAVVIGRCAPDPLHWHLSPAQVASDARALLDHHARHADPPPRLT